MKNFRRGFTITELLIVISVMSLFLLMSFWGFIKLQDRSFNEGNRVNAEGFVAALDEIYLAGATTHGAVGVRGEYPDISQACLDESNTIFEDIIEKQPGLPNDLKVVFIKNYTSPATSDLYDLSNGEVQANGTIQPDPSQPIATTAQMMTCSSSPAEVDLSKSENQNVIVYQPIATYNNRDICRKIQREAGLPEGMCGGGNRNSYCYDRYNIYSGAEIECKHFNVYYLEKDGDKFYLSDRITSKR